MRIISQDGEFDYPYENSVVFFSSECYGENTVKAQLIGDEETITLGEYSSREKVLETMKMLREAWLKESVEFENGIYHRNTVFQFPQDDEV